MFIEKIYTFDHSLNMEMVLYIDSLISYLTSFASLVFTKYLDSLELVCAAWSFLCFYLYLRFRGTFPSSKAILCSILLCLGVFLISKGHYVFIILYPLFSLLALQGTIREDYSRNRLFLLILKRILELFYAFLAGPLAFAFYVLSLILSQSLITLNRIVMILSTLVISLYTIFDIRVFDFPDSTRFSSISSFLKMGEIAFGQERLPFTGIYSSYALSNSFCLFVLTVMLASYLPSFIRGWMIRSNEKDFASESQLIFAVIFFVISSFLFLQEPSYYVNSPEAVLYKIIPGLIWRISPALIPSIVWIFLFVFYEVVFSNSKKDTKYKAFAFIFCILVLFIKDQPYVTSYSKLNDSSLIPVEISPSRYVLSSYNRDAAIIPRVKSEYQKIFAEIGNCKISTSRNQDQSGLLLDGKARTIWHTKGNQLRGDFVEFICPNIFSFDRVRLVAPSTDFPRAFKIEVFRDNEYEVIDQFKPWNGAISLTKEGYPYFSSQGDVVVYFDRTITTSAIRITLLEGDSVFDWSVSELVFEKIST